jgi:salicylate hydroxylase
MRTSRLTKIINMIEKTSKWPLMTGNTIDRWVSKSGRLLMLGDAAHAMVPYMSQGTTVLSLPPEAPIMSFADRMLLGAAMAVEDGAALAESLSHVYSLSDSELGKALGIFQSVRVLRSSQMQEASLVNGTIWHFPDGVEQQARDAAMRPEVEGRHFIESPNQWSDPVTQSWAYGYDAVEAIREAWAEEQKAAL